MLIDRWMSRLSLGVVLLALTMASAQAATRYVAVTGDDTGNNCLLFTSPCLTIGHAVSESIAGDTVLAAVGTYSETVVVNKSLTITGPGATVDGALRLAANDITIDDISISGGATVLGEVAGLYLDGATSGHVISDVTLTGTGTPAARGILFGANVSNVSVSGTTIDGWSTGIYLNPSPNANINISGNIISNNFSGIGGDDYSDVTISNNDFLDNNEGIGYSGAADGPTITTNTFDGNGVFVQTYFGAVLDLEQIAADNGFSVSAINSTQGGLFSTLQAAIDAASDGDTVVASAGTFTEDLVFANINGLTLLGAQAGVTAGVDGIRNASSTVDESIIIGTFSFGGGAPSTFDLTIDGFRLEQTSMSAARIGGELNLHNLIVEATSTYFVSTVGTFTDHQLVLQDSTVSGARGFSIENAQLTSAVISNNIFNQPAASLISGSALDGAATITGNIFNGPRGINILSNDNIVSNNVFNVNDGARGIDLYEVTGNLISSNVFNADNVTGILVRAGGRGEAELLNTISDNQFLGVNATGIDNTLAKDVNAACNWWGDASGPGGDAGGSGSVIIGPVDFQPWQVAAGGACTGYTSPVVRDRDGAVFGSFTDAIADGGTIDGDTLIGADAVYEESFTVNKALTITGAGSATVIDGGMASSNGISIPGGQTDVTISNLRVQNFTGTCIRGGVGNNNTLIDTVEIANCDGPGNGGGIYFDGPVDNITITNSTITNANWRSIVIWNGFKTNITITDNIVTGDGGLCCGIELQDGTASGVTITGNVVSGHGDSGIGLTGLTGGAGPNLIANNTVTDNGRFGIEIKNPNGTAGNNEIADGAIVVRDNIVGLTAPVGDLRDLVGIAVFRRVVLAGNVDIPTGVIVRNNTVTGYSQASDSDGFGIVVEGTQMRVFDNTLEDNDVGVQRQSGHQPYPGDGDQSNLADEYFGRGNSPVVCAQVGANVFTNNLIDERDVQQPGAEGPDPRVTNLDNNAFHCTIQSGVDADSTLAGHSLMIDPGVFEETVVVDKALSLIGDPSGVDRPVITWAAPVAAGEETLIRVQAQDVSIDGFELLVDQTFIGEAIRTEGDASGLAVSNNHIAATASDPNNIVSFGIRNAIAVNPIGRPGNVGGGFGPVSIIGNEIVAIPTGVGIGGFFRAGLAMDTANGSLVGNDILAVTHDAIIRFVLGGNIVVDDNDFRGGGLQLAEFNPTGPVSVINNRFVPDAGLVAAVGAGQSSMRLQNNPNTIDTTVSGNSYTGHVTAIRAENYPALSIAGNQFTPVADQSYQHVVVSNRVNASNYIAPLEIDVAIDGNQFDGGGEPGVALVFDNLNCCDDVGTGNTTASFGELRVGGVSPNNFDAGLSQYIVLDDTSGLVSFGLAQTEAQPFFADVNAEGNVWAGVAGAAQNESERAATRARIVDNRVNGDLGNVILDFIGATVEGTTSVQGIGAPVLGVAGVNVTGSQDGIEANSVQSGVGGAYSLPQMPEGDLDVAASLAGFAPVTQGVTVTEGGTATGVDFLLDSSVVAAFSASAGGSPLNGQSFFAARDVTDVDLSVARTDGGQNVDFYVSLTVFDSLGNEIDYINDGLFSTATLIALDGLLGEGNNFTLAGNDSLDLLNGATLEVGPNADQLDVATLSFRLIDGRFGASGSRIVHAATNFNVTIEPEPSIALQGLETSTLTAVFSTEVVSTAAGYAGMTPAQVAATAVDPASKEAFLLSFYDFNSAELALITDWTAVMVNGSDTELSVTFGSGLFELSYALDLGNNGAARINAAWAGTDDFETLSGQLLSGPAEPAYKVEFTVPYDDATGVDYSAAVTTTFIDVAKPLLRPFAPGIESGTSTSDPVTINFATGSYATGLAAEYSRNGGAPVSYTSGDELTAAGDYELTVTNISNPNVAADASTTIRFTIEAGLALSITGPMMVPLADEAFYEVNLQNLQDTDPGENVEALFSVSRPGIAVGDLVVDYCQDSAAAGTPENCATWLPLTLSDDGGSLSGRFGPAAGFPVPVGYDATTFIRAAFTEPGNYDVTVDIAGIDSESILATDNLLVSATELSLDIETGVPAGVPDSETGWAYYTTTLVNLGDELPENVALWVAVDGIDDALKVSDNLEIEYFNGTSWENLGWAGQSSFNYGYLDRDAWFLGRPDVPDGTIEGFPVGAQQAFPTPVRVNFDNDLYDLTISVETADQTGEIFLYGLFEEQIGVITDPVDLEFDLVRGVTATEQPPRWDYFTATLSNTDGGATPDNIVLFVEVAGTDFGAGDALEFWNGTSWQTFGWDAGREAWFLGRDGAGGVSGFPIDAGEVFPIEVRANFVPDSYDFTVSVESLDDQIVGVGGLYATFNQTVELLPTAATITFNAADLVQTFDGNVKTVGVTTAPEADLDVAFTFDPAPPVNAGSYLVIANFTDPYFDGSATTSLLIEKGQADVTLSDLSQVYAGGAELPVSVTTDPAGLDVSVTYDGSTTVPTDVGNYSVVATVNDANWSGSAAGILQITQATADVTLSDLVQTFDGTPRAVSVATVPVGLDVTVTYDGSASAPVNAGSYDVVATVVDDNYSGSAAGTLVVEQASVVDIQIGNTVQVYDGSPKTVSVTTDPAGLGFVVTYDGDPAAPVNAGNYDVVVTIDEQNYVGSAMATLVIEQAVQVIDFPALPDRSVNDSPFTLTASADSGLAVSFALISGPATLVGDEVTLTGSLGEVVIEASQAGDANWVQAPTVQRSFQVTEGTGTQIEAISNTEISGVAGQPVAAADLPVVRVLDEFDNPVAGVTVAFEIATGSGSLTGATQVSDGDGLATLGGWTLGAEATQTVQALAPGLSGSPVNFNATVTPAADLRVTIDDNRDTIEVGERNTYVVVITNSGPNAVNGVAVDVDLPAELDDATAEWTCFPAGGATCQGTGSGDLADTVDVPVDSSLVYILQADVVLGATQTIVNTAVLTPPAGVVIVDESALESTVITEIVVTEDGIFQDRFEEGASGFDDGVSLGGSRAELSGFIELPAQRSDLLPVQRLVSARASFGRVVFEITLAGAEGRTWVRLSARDEDNRWQHSPWQPLATTERLLAFDYIANSGLLLLAGEELELTLQLNQNGQPVHRLITSPKVGISIDD